MHIFFVGIGGTGIGPLALIAKQAGYEVSGSDSHDSSYVGYLKKQGITNLIIGQNTDSISYVHKNQPIDWLVHSSAIPNENPELTYAKKNNIHFSKRDEFLNYILKSTNQKLIAIAGTHGKSTTTAMLIWLFKQLKIPVSYSVGAKLSFGAMGEFNPKAEYFVYEADEYDHNFLSFHPVISIITGVAYDHPDIYPTPEDYNQAFRDFLDQSNCIIAHQKDIESISVQTNNIHTPDCTSLSSINLTGEVNRQNAQLAITAMSQIAKNLQFESSIDIMNKFPGLSRRFEKIIDNIYTDYAHTPEKIRGALQTAFEASNSIVVIYEGLHNTRQHFIKKELENLFEGIKKLYVVPSYIARENESLGLLTPEKLCQITQKPTNREPAELNDKLKNTIQNHANKGDLVLCLSAGGAGSLDEWLRNKFLNL